jgi:hypothetical protein
VHGWIYSIQDGLINDMDVAITSQDEIAPAYRTATKPLAEVDPKNWAP